MHVANSEYSEFGVGKLKLIPKHFHRSGQITDLVRVESGGAPIEGQTIDLELDRASELPLIAGNYQFAQYLSLLTIDGERRKSKRPLTIHPREVIEIPFQVFVTDKKWASLKASGLIEGSESVTDKRRKISLFRAVMPLKVQ